VKLRSEDKIKGIGDVKAAIEAVRSSDTMGVAMK
jgi:hypothetical protein